MVLCLDGEPLYSMFCGRCFWDGETFEDSVDLKPEVVVVVRGVVFLDYEYFVGGAFLSGHIRYLI